MENNRTSLSGFNLQNKPQNYIKFLSPGNLLKNAIIFSRVLKQNHARLGARLITGQEYAGFLDEGRIDVFIKYYKASYRDSR